MPKKSLKLLKEEFIRTQTAKKQADKGIQMIYDVLNVRGIRYSPDELKERVIKLSLQYQLEEDLAYLIRYLVKENKLKPETLDHFWGYLVRTMQYPPFEPTYHFKKRNGKKKLWGREWRYLMKIKRYPGIINNNIVPEWLSYALTYNSDFATVYNNYALTAREKLHELGETEIKDVNYGNLGMKKSIMDIDLEKILRNLEES